jgi:hypothetical protein
VHQNPLINIEAAPGDENIDEEVEEANIEAGGVRPGATGLGTLHSLRD